MKKKMTRKPSFSTNAEYKPIVSTSKKGCYHCNAYLKEPVEGLRCNVFRLSGYEVQEKEFEGELHLVAPVVLMVEGSANSLAIIADYVITQASVFCP